MKLKQWVKVLVALGIIFTNVGCDQITKETVRKEISSEEAISVIDEHFVLTKVENTGAAMSMGENLPPFGKTIFLQFLPFVLLVLMFFYSIRKKQTSRINLVAISFIIGGGIGNLYDRVLYQSVTDFMYLEWGSFHTGIFNMADVSVVVGVLLLVFNLALSEIQRLRLKSS